MSLLRFCEWLAATPGSEALHTSLYVYQLVSTVHVVTLFLFVGTAAVLDLRLLGAVLVRVPASEVAARLRPWTTLGFVLMAISGALLFYANPTPRYQNLFFRFKMLVLAVAGLNAWIFHTRTYRNVATWDLDRVPPRGARMAGAFALAFWAILIVSGRMIAYDWFACRRPQPPIVRLLAGCEARPR